ncbi:hypothetical protein BH11CYA1_BH11CYA1_19510 [soil metagenome]
MKAYIVRLFLIAAAFHWAFPMIKGMDTHGSFVSALGAGFVFALVGWLVEALAIVLTTFLTITTFGLALLVLIPAWILGFWLIPAITLKVLADLMPAFLTINGWMPALWGGLIMLFIGVITSPKSHLYD